MGIDCNLINRRYLIHVINVSQQVVSALRSHAWDSSGLSMVLDKRNRLTSNPKSMHARHRPRCMRAQQATFAQQSSRGVRGGGGGRGAHHRHIYRDINASQGWCSWWLARWAANHPPWWPSCQTRHACAGTPVDTAKRDMLHNSCRRMSRLRTSA